MFIDVKKAHLKAICDDPGAFVDLPDEDTDEGMCGKLRRWLYGMRGAANGWEKEYTGKMTKEACFKVGRYSPNVFWHEARELRCVVHGDDFTFMGSEGDLRWIEGLMRGWYEVKMRGILGPEVGDEKKMDVLNRWIEWGKDGLEVRADPRHAVKLIEDMGLETGSNGSAAPGRKDADDGDEEEVADELSKIETTRFRGLAARANYLA